MYNIQDGSKPESYISNVLILYCQLSFVVSVLLDCSPTASLSVCDDKGVCVLNKLLEEVPQDDCVLEVSLMFVLDSDCKPAYDVTAAELVFNEVLDVTCVSLHSVEDFPSFFASVDRLLDLLVLTAALEPRDEAVLADTDSSTLESDVLGPDGMTDVQVEVTGQVEVEMELTVLTLETTWGNVSLVVDTTPGGTNFEVLVDSLPALLRSLVDVVCAGVTEGAALQTATKLAARSVGEMLLIPAGVEAPDTGLISSLGVDSVDSNGVGGSSSIFSSFRLGMECCLDWLGNDSLFEMSDALLVSSVVDTGANGGIKALDFCCKALGTGSCLSCIAISDTSGKGLINPLKFLWDSLAAFLSL